MRINEFIIAVSKLGEAGYRFSPSGNALRFEKSDIPGSMCPLVAVYHHLRGRLFSSLLDNAIQAAINLGLTDREARDIVDASDSFYYSNELRELLIGACLSGCYPNGKNLQDSV